MSNPNKLRTATETKTFLETNKNNKKYSVSRSGWRNGLSNKSCKVVGNHVIFKTEEYIYIDL